MTDFSTDISSIRLSDYHYDLPTEKIAQKPLEQRDESKLLVYNQGQISHQIFKDLSENLPEGSLLVFNDTRVIRARLYFRRKTGALIEIFLLNPESPREIQQAMQTTESCLWSCMIGRKKKWEEGEILRHDIKTAEKQFSITATLIDREKNLVKLSWDDAETTQAELLDILGELPLPPYISRKATAKDDNQYQTIYARQDGAVAAPTAGIHFTDKVFQHLASKGIRKEYVTLHVGAGTFLPVKQDQVIDHDMHSEQLIITLKNLNRLIEFSGKTIPVGTTSMRVIESIYWLGVQLILQPEFYQSTKPFRVEKLYPYQHNLNSLPSVEEALNSVKRFMERHKLTSWNGQTEIFIMPGYPFKMSKGLITNYHMPATTLILLVAALIGEKWREVYQSALDNGYRFLSYGDSSLLIP